MTDGAVLGVHDGMVIEYDPTTLEPSPSYPNPDPNPNTHPK